MSDLAYAYQGPKLFIGGEWRDGRGGRTIPVANPATGQIIGTVAHAALEDLNDAAVASQKGFQVWSAMSAFERSKIMRNAADLVRDRKEQIAWLMTREQGKPLSESMTEISLAADIIDWFAEEARRTYGQIVPSRTAAVRQLVVKEPVGPVAAFTPWNFPINQVVRKLSTALAAGCSIIVKAPEETPASPAELIRAFADAGVPNGAIGLVFGEPTMISEYLIANPIVKKISFTGSTPVGKHLAALAGQHMKRATMELGGHAPVIVMDDADVEEAVKLLAATKLRNAGQVCISPTRFLVQRGVFDAFVEAFAATFRSTRIGNGADPATQMGPLANRRRIAALEELVADALEMGADLKCGGGRIGDEGYFFAPTVLVNVPVNARAMNEEPFGPLAIINPFETLEEAVQEANRLPYGLAAYAFTSSLEAEHVLSTKIEAGMVTINHIGFSLPEVPFGGIKDSGYGNEGGSEAIEAYQVTKLVTTRAAPAR